MDHFTAADTNADGAIDQAEWDAAWAAHEEGSGSGKKTGSGSGKKSAASGKKSAASGKSGKSGEDQTVSFAQIGDDFHILDLDTNGDGGVSVPEFEEFFGEPATAENLAEFDAMDTNSDTIVDQAEWDAFIEANFTFVPEEVDVL